jgi:sugar phosphate isomerase/epimerase
MEHILGCTTRPYAKIPYAEAFQRIAAAGYADVAIFFDVGITPESSPDHTHAVREVAHEVGLTPSLLIAHAELEHGLEEAVARYRRMVAHAAALGATWLLDLGTGREELYERYFALLDQALPYAANLGVQITLKPHGGVTLTTDALIAAYERVNHPSFGICYDPGNIIYYTKGAEQPEDNLSRVAPLVTTGIIKDCIVRDGKPDVMITPGEGWVDFEAVLAGLIAGGFAGPLYLECVGGNEIDEIDANVHRAHAFVDGILAKVSAG